METRFPLNYWPKRAENNKWHNAPNCVINRAKRMPILYLIVVNENIHDN